MQRGEPVRPTESKGAEKENVCRMCGMEGLDVEESEEAAEVRLKKYKFWPTAKEREEHEITHLPFRDWCETCIAARAKEEAHKEREISESCQEVHIDYCFFAE